MGLSFTVAVVNSRVRVPRDSWPHFTVSDSRIPHPGGRGPCIYILQEQGGPVISPGTVFPFHRLLPLAGLRWRYSTPPQLYSCKTVDKKVIYSFKWESSISETVRNRAHVYIQFFAQNGRYSDPPYIDFFSWTLYNVCTWFIDTIEPSTLTFLSPSI
jgi:hypothetical protein